MSRAITDQITEYARNIQRTSFFDMLPYFREKGRIEQAQGVINRINCYEMAHLFTTAVNEDSFLRTSGVNARVVPCVHINKDFNWDNIDHAAADITIDGDFVGIVDPAYGIYLPLNIGEIRQVQSWRFGVESAEDYLIFRAKHFSNENIRKVILSASIDKATMTSLINNYTNKVRRDRVSYSYILSPKTGQKVNKLILTAEEIRYRGRDQITSEAALGSSGANTILENFMSDIEIWYRGTGLSLDRDTFLDDIQNFSKCVNMKG